MRIIKISTILVLISLSINCISYAGTVNDIFKLYGLSTKESYEDIKVKYDEAKSKLDTLKVENEKNKDYSEFYAKADSYISNKRDEVRRDILNIVKENVEIEHTIDNDLFLLSIDELVELDSQYKSNKNKIEQVLGELEELKMPNFVLQEEINLIPAIEEVERWKIKLDNAVETDNIGESYPIKPPLGTSKFSVTSPFGYRVDPIKGTKGVFHSGLDMACPQGTPILAAWNGKVVKAGTFMGTGNMVAIEHGNGLKTCYFHMSKIDVSAGQIVKQGDKIGEVGSTGYSTGPHLHWEIRINGIAYDPQKVPFK